MFARASPEEMVPIDKDSQRAEQTIEALRDDLQARLQVCLRHAVLSLCNPETATVVEKLLESAKERVQRVVKEGGGDFQSHVAVAMFRRLRSLSAVKHRELSGGWCESCDV
jgi:hypothetical protein